MNLDDGDDAYNWLWLSAVQPGHWELTDAQAARMRQVARVRYLAHDELFRSKSCKAFDPAHNQFV